MPDNKGIPEGKKRYTLTLTEETMNRMHSYLGKNHAPKSMLSSLVDEFLSDTLRTVDELDKAQRRKGESVGLGDLFTVIGNIMTDKEREQRKLL
jgi:hypothetical protein